MIETPPLITTPTRVLDPAVWPKGTLVADKVPSLYEAAQYALDALIAIDAMLHRNGLMVGVENPAIAPLRDALAHGEKL